MDEICKVCQRPRHFCESPHEEDGKPETGHYGKTPARFCDECRLENIKATGRPGDEPREDKLH